MQHHRVWQERILEKFLFTSRQHLSLIQAPTAVVPPRVVAGRPRPSIRALLLIGSLGTVFGGPAFATEASRQPAPSGSHKAQPQAKRGDQGQSAVARVNRDPTKS